MATSLLFSPDMLSTYNPSPPSKFRDFPPQGNQWLLSQSHSPRSSHQQVPRTMPSSNGSNDGSYVPPSNSRVDLGEYTFTTHGPNNEDFASWPNNNTYHGPLNIQTDTTLARLPSSPDYSGDNWNSYSNFNEQSSSSPTTYIIGYSPDSVSTTLGPFGIQQPRSPSHISPTGSDPTLSPLYSASPGLSPSTPGSTYMDIASPVMNNVLGQESNATTGSGAPERPLLSHREQLIQFREVLMRQSVGNFGPFLPQQMYKPHTTSDRKRYVEEVMLEYPIYFKTEHPYQEGILLKDALHSRTKKLVDRDQVVFEGRGPSVSIRLEWPGYRQWSRQIPTKDFRSPPQPITLAKLAKNIAKCVQRFMQDRKSQAMEDESDQNWKIGDGPNDITLDDLVLVSIHHVSLGSWQPHLRLVRPHRQHRPAHGQTMTMPRIMPPISLPPMNGSPNALSFNPNSRLS